MSSNPCLGFEPALKMALAKSQNAPYKTVRPKLDVSQSKSLISLTWDTPSHSAILRKMPLSSIRLASKVENDPTLFSRLPFTLRT